MIQILQNIDIGCNVFLASAVHRDLFIQVKVRVDLFQTYLICLGIQPANFTGLYSAFATSHLRLILIEIQVDPSSLPLRCKIYFMNKYL